MIIIDNGTVQMLGNRTVVVDTFCEIAIGIKSITDEVFYDFSRHTLIPGAVYVVSRQQMFDHASEFKRLAKDGVIDIVFANPAEGADTMYWQCQRLDLLELIQQRKILLVSGGKLHGNYPCLVYEHLLIQSLNYDENRNAIKQYTDLWWYQRPYKFLFLNGRTRPHRKYLLERFQNNGLLDQCLWTNLDPRTSTGFRNTNWYSVEDESVPQILPQPDWAKTSFPVKSLPSEYECKRYSQSSLPEFIDCNEDMFVKKTLFNQEWGEIYLEAKPYADTYFSLVTETTFDYSESFRTEKISKPLAIGHPWIVAANAGFYKEIKELGFRTFDHLIDESFDSIQNPQDRCNRIAEVVEDLCQQDLQAFIQAASETCLHNQQQLRWLNQHEQQQFVDRFITYVTENFNR